MVRRAPAGEFPVLTPANPAAASPELPPRLALREIELVDVADQPLILAEVDEAFKIVGVVDAGMVRISSDETVAGGDRRRRLADAVVRVRAFENGLLRVAPVREARLERLVE